MFAINFYIFSAFLSYTDLKKFIVPNTTLLSMVIMMLIFGLFESKITSSSILLSLSILLFFIVLLLLSPKTILGGGDIKYMMVIGLYLGVEAFALFLIVTGVLQSLALLYVQKVKMRKIAPMVPIMFLSVIIVETLIALEIYTLKL